MKYFVTFSAMDPKVEANFFWHSNIYLSQWDDDQGGKIEVIDNYGFYGLPSTTDPESYAGQLKKKLKFDTDLQGNHGWLKHEEYRYLDRGYGLHGVTFELDESAFFALQERCKKQCADQNDAINEAAFELMLEPTKTKYRIHPYEQHSAQIFEHERQKSTAQHRPARLSPFDLNVTLGLGGPSVATSHTCKSHVIDLLKETLHDKHIARLTENGKHPTIPRLSGKMEQICLHSEGPLRTHTKKNGEKYDYRDNLKDEVRLFWTVPPQEIETWSDETRAQFFIDPKYDRMIKKLVGKLQKLEWFFHRHAVRDELRHYQGAIDQLLMQIQAHYQTFANIPAKTGNGKPIDENTWSAWLVNSLFSPARNYVELKLQENIRNSTIFLNMIYCAIVDGYVLDVPGDGLASSWFLALSVVNQKQVCAILERPYLESPATIHHTEVMVL